MIADTIKRLVLKLFPELSARHHLPIFAEVVGVRETPSEGDLCDEFRPFYAVDVQVLDEYGEPDPNYPILKDVIMSVPVAGQEMGQFAYPENGTWVEIAFAYGSANKPFIRSILPHRLSLPPLERGEQRWQHNPESFQRIDKDGNHERLTDLAIHDQSLTRLIEAMDVVENFHRSVKNSETNDTEIIGAIKRIEAFGAMVLQSGGVMDLASIDHMRLTTKANAIIRVLGDINSTTDGKQHFEAPLSWVGSSDENIFRLLSEQMEIIIDLCEVLRTHTHPDAGVINQAAGVTTALNATTALKNRLDPIIEL